MKSKLDKVRKRKWFPKMCPIRNTCPLAGQWFVLGFQCQSNITLHGKLKNMATFKICIILSSWNIHIHCSLVVKWTLCENDLSSYPAASPLHVKILSENKKDTIWKEKKLTLHLTFYHLLYIPESSCITLLHYRVLGKLSIPKLTRKSFNTMQELMGFQILSLSKNAQREFSDVTLLCTGNRA